MKNATEKGCCCPYCGDAAPEDSAVCRPCRVKFTTCPECGKAVAVTVKRCPHCSAATVPAEENPNQDPI